MAFIAYFGVLDPSKMLPERCQSTAGMDCVDKASVISSGVKVALRNNMGFPILVKGIDGVACTGDSGGVPSSSEKIITSFEFVPFQVENNDVFKLKIDCQLISGRDYEDSLFLEWENPETGLDMNTPIQIRIKVS